MKKLPLFLIILLFSPIILFAQEEQNESDSNSANDLYGEWSIDLRPSPDAAPYFQTFKVESIQDKEFFGTFYGSKIKKAIINQEWGKVYFAFYSSDQNNNYYHSGYIQDGKIYGTTYCPSRNFTSPWIGIKKIN